MQSLSNCSRFSPARTSVTASAIPRCCATLSRTHWRGDRTYSRSGRSASRSLTAPHRTTLILIRSFVIPPGKCARGSRSTIMSLDINRQSESRSLQVPMSPSFCSPTRRRTLQRIRVRSQSISVRPGSWRSTSTEPRSRSQSHLGIFGSMPSDQFQRSRLGPVR
jgi:hypothetical protein